MKTPKVLRRTPKITGNLSTCADDIKNVRYFQKLGLNSRVRCPSANSTTTSDSSYESATNISLEKCCSKDKHESFYCSVIKEGYLPAREDMETDSFQSAENLLEVEILNNNVAPKQKTIYMETHFDEDYFKTPETCIRLDKQILRSAVSLDIRPGITSFAKTHSQCSTSPQILSPSTPQEIDPDLISNLAIDLNLEEENRSAIHNPILKDDSSTKGNSIDSGSVCKTPSEPKYVTFSPQVLNIDPKFFWRTSTVDEGPSKSERWSWRRPDKWGILSKSNKKTKISAKICGNYSPKLKRRNDEEPCFSKNESLPLLSGLSGVHEKASPNFVRRKKYVYPITSIGKGESSV